MTDREKRINYNHCIMNCLPKSSNYGMLVCIENIPNNKKFLIRILQNLATTFGHKSNTHSIINHEK